MKNYLVTGGLGFIGFTLVKKLLTDPENNIYVVDNCSAGVYDEEAKLIKSAYGDRLTIIFEDLLEVESLPRVDGVYHLAAHIGTKGQHDNPFNVLEDNIAMMDKVIRTYGLDTRIVYSSTIEVYTGSRQPKPTKENCHIGWDNPKDPRWAYSFSKFAAEMLLSALPNNNWAISRFSNVYGPRMCHDYVVKAMFDRITKSESPLKIYSPSDTRPFIYVDDVVDGLICLMNNGMANGEVFNIGSDQETKIEDLYNMGLEISGRWLPTQPEPDTQIESRLPDISKAKKLLGWYPKVSLREGLLKTWEYYGSNNR